MPQDLAQLLFMYTGLLTHWLLEAQVEQEGLVSSHGLPVTQRHTGKHHKAEEVTCTQGHRRNLYRVQQNNSTVSRNCASYRVIQTLHQVINGRKKVDFRKMKEIWTKESRWTDWTHGHTNKQGNQHTCTAVITGT